MVTGLVKVVVLHWWVVFSLVPAFLAATQKKAVFHIAAKEAGKPGDEARQYQHYSGGWWWTNT